MSTNGRGRGSRPSRTRTASGGGRGWWNLPADVVAEIRAAVEQSRNGGLPWPPGPPGSGATPPPGGVTLDPSRRRPVLARDDPLGTGAYLANLPAAVPCPACSEVAYEAAPDGAPGRRCWGCGHVWEPVVPADDQASEPEEERSSLPAGARRAFVLAIVGSRSLDGSEEAQRVIGEVLDRYQAEREHDDRDLVVISGDARGIDRMALDEAYRRGIFHDEIKADGNNWPAYRARNLEIARDCDALVRIADPESRTYGSGWTRDRARELGKPTEEYVIARTAGRAERVGAEAER